MPQIEENVLLNKYTTLNVGGPAEYFAVARSSSDMEELSRYAHERNWKILVIGGGSNLLISDGGFKGLVIKNEIEGIYPETLVNEVKVTVGSGEVWDEFVERAVNEGWWGVENLSAIPGSVGATPVQNVGAYGTEVAEIIDSVQALDATTGEIKVLTSADCLFGYRDSCFKNEAGKHLIILSVTFKLKVSPAPKLHYRDLALKFKDKPIESITPNEIRQAVISIRSEKFPDWRDLGTVGSFFKNPIIKKEECDALLAKYPDLPAYEESGEMMKVSLGWILDKVCGLRGYREGNVGLYEKQALVLINFGEATTEEITRFADRVAKIVREKTGLVIETEPTFV